MKILVVEDERKVSRFVSQALQEQAYTVRVVAAAAAARNALAEDTFDAIVLDLSLPDGDGLSLLEEWRSAGFNEPVLILSARDAVTDRIAGLNRGADDYLAKPFSVDELVARVRSLLRRQAVTKSTVLVHRDLRLDLLARELRREGEVILLTSREFALVELLLQNVGRVLSRTQIAERVWDASYDLETNVIDVYVRRIRAKLERPGAEPLIRTVRGTGYQLLA